MKLFRFLTLLYGLCLLGALLEGLLSRNGLTAGDWMHLLMGASILILAVQE